MAPPSERFQSEETAGGELDDGLVVQLELILVQGLHEVDRELEPRSGLAGATGVECHDVAGAASFGGAHRGARSLDELGWRTVLGCGDASAPRYPHLVAAHVERFS